MRGDKLFEFDKLGHLAEDWRWVGQWAGQWAGLHRLGAGVDLYSTPPVHFYHWHSGEEGGREGGREEGEGGREGGEEGGRKEKGEGGKGGVKEGERGGGEGGKERGRERERGGKREKREGGRREGREGGRGMEGRISVSGFAVLPPLPSLPSLHSPPSLPHSDMGEAISWLEDSPRLSQTALSYYGFLQLWKEIFVFLWVS